MIRRLFVLAMVGLIGCPLLAPLSGCDGVTSEPKPTIDLSTPIKTPEVPGTQKLELSPKAAKKKQPTR